MNTRINLPAVLAYLRQSDIVDNEPHFPKLASFPHHFHDRTGTAFESPLSGDVFADLDIVMAVISTIIRDLEFT